ncbi:MAG: M48 family metalloprotease [Polyangiaceae bacterium]|nr:M48 family metalloprotease [Polyangiaceae bacterium]
MRLLPVFALVVACSRPAAPPPAVPAPSAERVSGQILSELLLGSHGPLEDPELTAYVRRVGARVARAVGRRDETWRVELSDDPKPLGHALPGGTLLVSRGALAYLSSEAELAAILAHELAHAAHGHTELGKSALPAHATLGAARQSALDADEERQADALAVRYVARAGYDPKAVGRALAALARAVALDCQRELGRVDCASAHDDDDPHPPGQRARRAWRSPPEQPAAKSDASATSARSMGCHSGATTPRSRTAAFVPRRALLRRAARVHAFPVGPRALGQGPRRRAPDRALARPLLPRGAALERALRPFPEPADRRPPRLHRQPG